MRQRLNALIVQCLRVLIISPDLEQPFVEEACVLNPKPHITLANDLLHAHLPVAFTVNVGLTLPVTEHVVQLALDQVVFVARNLFFLCQNALFEQVVD